MDIEAEHREPLLESERPSQQTSHNVECGRSAPPENEPSQKPSKTKTQKAIRRTFKGTAHLAKLLPTGSVLTFQFLSPVFTHQGQCKTDTNRYLTVALLSFCAAVCFVISFTDSFRDRRGKVRYGLATFEGLWVVDSSVALSAEEAAKYRLRCIDLFHAFVSVFVFAAVALFDQNVVKCLFPAPSEEAKELLTTIPVAIGVVCSILFLSFPTRRHGISTPLSRN